MASSNKSPVALFLVINLVFFAVASATTCPSTISLTSLAVCILPGSACCSCFTGITSLEAAVCLCAAIKANICVLGLGVDATAYIKDTLGECTDFEFPSGYVCV